MCLRRKAPSSTCIYMMWSSSWNSLSLSLCILAACAPWLFCPKYYAGRVLSRQNQIMPLTCPSPCHVIRIATLPSSFQLWETNPLSEPSGHWLQERSDDSLPYGWKNNDCDWTAKVFHRYFGKTFWMRRFLSLATKNILCVESHSRKPSKEN